MTTYSNLTNDRELLRIKTKDDQLREVENKTVKDDLENILKSLKYDNEYYKKKYKNLYKKKVLLIIAESLIGS